MNSAVPFAEWHIGEPIAADALGVNGAELVSAHDRRLHLDSLAKPGTPMTFPSRRGRIREFAIGLVVLAGIAAICAAWGVAFKELF